MHSTTIRSICVAAVFLLAGCASGGTMECFRCAAHPEYIHGYYSSRGTANNTHFVDEDEVVHVTGPTEVLGYFNAVMYCSSGPWVRGFDHATIYAGNRCHARGRGNATIYYRAGADVRVEQPARAFSCPGADNEPWDTTKCVHTH